MGAKEDEMECAYLLCLPQVNKEERLERGIILVKLLLRKKSWRKTKNDLKPNTKKLLHLFQVRLFHCTQISKLLFKSMFSGFGSCILKTKKEKKKMKKALLIIDMQNDFITGSLANPDAAAIVKPIASKIADFDGDVIATRDTHAENYLETAEGKRLPVPHCIENTLGWEIVTEIKAAMEKRGDCRILDKTSFGMVGPWSLGEYDSIEVVGTCTDICVVSNVLILKAAYPNLEIKVHANLCAGLTPEKHKAALSVMESCQVEIV